MFTGDIVFVERAPGTGPARNVKSWIEVYEKMATFQPEHIVPGHGYATGIETANRDTYDYLSFFYTEIGRMLDEGVELADAVNLD
jgi:glyoxylase-like metal-dependent hydrolase (beta-lactamase superfamily II)